MSVCLDMFLEALLAGGPVGPTFADPLGFVAPPRDDEPDRSDAGPPGGSPQASDPPVAGWIRKLWPVGAVPA